MASEARALLGIIQEIAEKSLFHRGFSGPMGFPPWGASLTPYEAARRRLNFAWLGLVGLVGLIKLSQAKLANKES